MVYDIWVIKHFRDRSHGVSRCARFELPYNLDGENSPARAWQYFSMDGKVIGGPSPRPLDVLRINPRWRFVSSIGNNIKQHNRKSRGLMKSRDTTVIND